MARQRRLKYRDPGDGYYHITSRTVLKSFILDDEAKEHFVTMLKQLTRVYFVKVVTFAVMSNHFHIVLRMLPGDQIDDTQLQERANRYYNEGRSKDYWLDYLSLDPKLLRRRWSDVSCFVQDLKQRFSRWYNRRNNNHGHVWSERFKSVMLEDGQAVLACMAYVDLNSLRAGMVKRPEEYRFSGLGHWVTGGRASSWLDRETLARAVKADGGRVAVHGVVSSDVTNTFTNDLSESSSVEDFAGLARIYRNEVKNYLAIVYREGQIARPGKASLSNVVAAESEASGFTDIGVFSLRRRIRHFSDGVFRLLAVLSG